MTYSKRRATFVTVVAVIGGIIGWALTVDDWLVSLPFGIFYTLLVVNTYPSVRLFSSLVPMEDGRHALTDVMLALLYTFLVGSFDDPQRFVLCALVMFLVASGKYSLMVGEIPHPRLLERKIRVDLLGALLCACALALMNAGWVLTAAWSLVIIFALGNIYVLALKPLYRL